MLHSQEVEIIVPDRIQKPEQLPLFLSVGPTLTMILPILLMTIVNSKIAGSNYSSFIYMSLVTGGTGCLLGVIWGLVNALYRKRRLRKQQEAAQKEYDRYLETMHEHLLRCAEDNRAYLCQKYPYIGDIDENNIDSYIWMRDSSDDDFGFVRIELGRVPSEMRLRCDGGRKQMFPDENSRRAAELVDEFSTLTEAPRGINFVRDRFVGINLEEDETSRMEAVLNIILSIAVSVDCDDARICIFYDENDKSQRKMVSSLKMLPHLWDDGRRIRLLSGKRDTFFEVATRLELGISLHNPYYLVFILSDKDIRNQPIYKRLTDRREDDRFSVFEIGDRESLPGAFRTFVDSNTYPRTERISYTQGEKLSRVLASKFRMSASESDEIPQFVDYMDMYGISGREDLNILGRWSVGAPSKSLKALIGIGEGGVKIYLDIHEKAHGPHGLIAGTTGSGKSELIETYLLSLCMNYSPADVNFFLIDYKGGGTGKVVMNLPHCAGCISNLSGNEIGRSLKAIASENQRRQRMLKEAGVSHADDYGILFHAGTVSEPMPHLILIIDEFAELKKEEPEFMKQLISLAAVGRSLGIHLILATQKPAGVVDDKIWSNSHFKLCLKVQDKQDSIDMLHRADAAFLTNPGSCCMQIGNDEYFTEFQTAYSGSIYAEGRRTPTAFLLDEIGKREGGNFSTGDKNSKTVLQTLSELITEEANNEQIGTARKLWMDELPTRIELADLADEGSRMMKKSGLHADKDRFFLLGMYDNPSDQRQGCICYAPSRHGYLCIGGGPASGKTQVLRTLLTQMEAPDEFVIVDQRGGGLDSFAFRGECLGLLDNPEGTDVFFYHLEREFRQRKNADPKNNIFVLIDGIRDFLAGLNEKRNEEFSRFLSEGIGCRIFFVVTCLSVADIPASMFAKFQTTLALNMNDKFQYGDMLRCYKSEVFPRENVPGRCLFKVKERVLECQIATETGKFTLHSSSDADEDIPKKGRRFPFIPPWPEYSGMIGDFRRERTGDKGRMVLPVGYSLKTGYVRGVDITAGGSVIVSGNNGSGANLLFEEIVMSLADLFGMKEGDYLAIDNPREFLSDLDNCRLISKEPGRLKIVLFDSDKDTDLLVSEAGRMLLSGEQGIHLGIGAANHRILDFSDLGYACLSTKLPEGYGFMKTNLCKHTIRIRIPGMGKEEDDDND